MKAKSEAFEKIAKRKLAKVAQLGLTNAEAEAMEFSELVEKGEESIKTKLKEVSTATDEKLQEQINEYKEKLADVTTKLSEVKELTAAEIEKIEQDFENKIQLKDTELLIKERAAETNFFNKDHSSVFAEVIKSSIEKDYKILPNGEILAKDGTKALSPDGKTVWKSLDEAWNHFSTPFVPVSNPGSGNEPAKREVPANIDPRIAKQLEYSQE